MISARYSRMWVESFASLSYSVATLSTQMQRGQLYAPQGCLILISVTCRLRPVTSRLCGVLIGRLLRIARQVVPGSTAHVRRLRFLQYHQPQKSHGDYKYGEPSWIWSRGHFRAQRTCSCDEGTARNSGSKRFCSQYKVYGKVVRFCFSLLTPNLLKFAQRYYLIHV